MKTRNNFEIINSILEIAHSSLDHRKNLERCLSNIRNYDRMRAWTCLQEMIYEYATEITIFGGLVDGIYIVYNIDFNNFSDYLIIAQLEYIADKILFYAVIKEGSRETVSLAYNWLAQTSKRH